MHDKEAIEMMTRAMHEIRDLHRQVDVLAPKAKAYEILCKVITVCVPEVPQGYGEDVARMLERRIEKINATPEKPEPTEKVDK